IAATHRPCHSIPTRRSTNLELRRVIENAKAGYAKNGIASPAARNDGTGDDASLQGIAVCDRGNLTDISIVAEAPLSHLTDFTVRSEEHTSELQSRENLVCRL